MFLTAKELQDRARAELGYPVGVALTIPIASGTEKVAAAVLVYREVPMPRARVVFPPYRLLLLDPSDGRVTTNRAVAPREVGPDAPVDQPLPRHPDERRVDDAAAFVEHKTHLLATFHEAWWAFAQGQVRFTPEQRAGIVASLEHFEEVAEKRILPWYEGVGAPFLSWLRGVRERT